MMGWIDTVRINADRINADRIGTDRINADRNYTERNPMRFRFAALLSSSLAMTALAGCQSDSFQDVAPTGASTGASAGNEEGARGRSLGADLNLTSPVPLPENVEPLPSRERFVAEGIDDSGEFPNVGTPRKTANTQISDAQEAAMEAKIKRLRAEQRANAAEAAAYRKRAAALRERAGENAAQTEKTTAK